MVSCARRKLIQRDRMATYHCWTRCVRRARLFGRDPTTNKDYSYRRDWIVNRQRQMARLFAIEVEFRSEMANHLHLVLRTRPRIAQRLSAHEVARRWLTITRLAKCMSDALPVPDPKKVAELAKDKKRIKRLRRRLCDISWFMGILCENIARRANQEDDVKGHFFESRFRCRECTDDNAVLLCGIYVDLNPILAGEASSPKTARHTSAYDRIQAAAQRKNAADRADAWMAELTVPPERKEDASRAFESRSGRRASDMGILSISLEDYLKLLTGTARLLKSGERQTIPKDLEAILDHMDVDSDMWLDTLDAYETSFCHVVGSEASMAKVAKRMDVSCLKGVTASRQIFK